MNEKGNISMKNVQEKRKPTSRSVDEQPPAKHRKTTSQIQKKPNKGNKEAEQGRHLAEESEARERDGKNTESISQDIKYKSSKKPITFDDRCTAFISNLSPKTTEDDLFNFFSDVGGVVDIRIVKDKFTKKSRGLAYVDFSDDAHLTAALEKNKQILFGKRLSILKSDPKQGRKKKVAGRSNRLEQGNTSKQIDVTGKSDSQEASEGGKEEQPPRPDEDIQLKGKNTFAVPRNVKPLGWSVRNQPKPNNEKDDENPKSNDEFRKMFLKK